MCAEKLEAELGACKFPYNFPHGPYGSRDAVVIRHHRMRKIRILFPSLIFLGSLVSLAGAGLKCWLLEFLVLIMAMVDLVCVVLRRAVLLNLLGNLPC